MDELLRNFTLQSTEVEPDQGSQEKHAMRRFSYLASYENGTLWPLVVRSLVLGLIMEPIQNRGPAR
jgi:hypothetical protein